MSFKNLEGQTACWIQRLQEYNFTSEHHQGRKSNNADALSCRPCQEECTHCHNVEARTDIKQARAVAAARRTEQLNDQAQWNSLSVRNGIWEHHGNLPTDDKNSPGNSPSEQSEQRADRTTWWAIKRSLGCQQDPEKCLEYVLLASGKKQCWEMV
jgi:hypothetical protein